MGHRECKGMHNKPGWRGIERVNVRSLHSDVKENSQTYNARCCVLPCPSFCNIFASSGATKSSEICESTSVRENKTVVG